MLTPIVKQILDKPSYLNANTNSKYWTSHHKQILLVKQILDKPSHLNANTNSQTNTGQAIIP